MKKFSSKITKKLEQYYKNIQNKKQQLVEGRQFKNKEEEKQAYQKGYKKQKENRTFVFLFEFQRSEELNNYLQMVKKENPCYENRLFIRYKNTRPLHKQSSETQKRTCIIYTYKRNCLDQRPPRTPIRYLYRKKKTKRPHTTSGQKHYSRRLLRPNQKRCSRRLQLHLRRQIQFMVERNKK